MLINGIDSKQNSQGGENRHVFNISQQQYCADMQAKEKHRVHPPPCSTAASGRMAPQNRLQTLQSIHVQIFLKNYLNLKKKPCKITGMNFTSNVNFATDVKVIRLKMITMQIIWMKYLIGCGMA